MGVTRQCKLVRTCPKQLLPCSTEARRLAFLNCCRPMWHGPLGAIPFGSYYIAETQGGKSTCCVAPTESINAAEDDTLRKTWCYRTASVCCQCLQWVTEQRRALQKNSGYRTPLCCPHCLRTQRVDSTKFSDGLPFRKIGAVEPPLFVVSICNG